MLSPYLFMSVLTYSQSTSKWIVQCISLLKDFYISFILCVVQNVPSERRHNIILAALRDVMKWSLQ